MTLVTYPFDELVEGMLQPEMVREAAELMRQTIRHSVETSILINNRSGGNAPMIAQKLAKEFFEG